MRTAGIGRQWVLDEKIQGLEREISWVMRRLGRTCVCMEEDAGGQERQRFWLGCEMDGKTEIQLKRRLRLKQKASAYKHLVFSASGMEFKMVMSKYE